MLIPPLTMQDRRELMDRMARGMNQYRACLLARDQAGADRAYADAEAAEAEYFQRLPVVSMGVCPFTGKALRRSFDPFGLDGPWWRTDSERPSPRPPHTFCVLRGAVHFQGRKPMADPVHEVRTGPEVPYVIPRVLELPSMIAVIADLSMGTGYRVFTIAYFADPRPPASELTADWLSSTHSYRTLFGEEDSVIPVDPWDFDLRPWIARGKVRWCPPGSDNTRLAPPGKPADCPFLDLPGRRENLTVRGDNLWNRGLPNGTPITPDQLLD